MAQAASKTAAPVKLSAQTLAQFSDTNQTPTYDRVTRGIGILHMSVGGFHRSHEAVYLDDFLNAQAEGDWMIAGVGLLPNDATNIAALQAQNGLYSVLERSPEQDSLRIVGSMKEALHAPTDPAAVIAKIASPEIRIISLTITEKGYYYDQNQNLDLNNPTIQADLNETAAPKTALGYLRAGLAARRAANAGPVTIMCCDNLPGNGELTKHILGQFLNACDTDLAAWVNANCSFPNAMVDRITPVTTQTIQDIVANDYGIDDAWPVVCEDFRQWILEDNFIAGRPALDLVGVQLVSDVEPYEKMKVRLLNGSHSALSYLSYLLGHRDVDAAMADPLIRSFVAQYMEDITPSVPDVPGIDLTAYKKKLVERFANKSIRDQVLRLAEDGSQKIRNAMVPPLQYALENNTSSKFIALALAGWFRFLQGTDAEGAAIPVKDPMSGQLQARAQSDLSAANMLAQTEIFGDALAGNAQITAQIDTFLQSFAVKGVKATIEDALR